MASAGNIDAIVARALEQRGVVTEAALDHARAVALRNVRLPIAELLVELEHARAEDVALVLSSLTGAPLWAGDGLDVTAARSVDPTSSALVVRRDGTRVTYATFAPHDELERQDVRFAAGATSAEPVVATPRVLARAMWEARAEQRIPEAARLLARDPRGGGRSDEDEARFRDACEADDAEVCVKLANVVALDLLWQCPGASVRVVLGDHPRLEVGFEDTFERVIDLGVPAARVESVLTRLVWRWKAMAGVEVGSGERSGWINVSSRTRHLAFAFSSEPTNVGLTAIVSRQCHWAGAGVPEDPRWGAWQQAMDQAGSATLDEGVAIERALRSAVRAAQEIGPEARIEEVVATWDLASFLDDQDREDEARGFARRALALAEELDLGPRARGGITALLGNTEVHDLAARVQAYTRADELLRSPGAGRSPSSFVAVNVAFAERVRGNPDRAIDAANAALTEEQRFLSGLGRVGAYAKIEAAHAYADLGRVAEAEASLREAASFAEHVGVDPRHLDLAFGRVALAAGRVPEALACFERGIARGGEDGTVFSPQQLLVGRAQALSQLGRVAEAQGAAERAMDALPKPSAFSAWLRGLLEPSMQRRGPYR